MRRLLPILQVAAGTHRGSVRIQNEDALAIDANILTGNMTTTLRSKLFGEVLHLLMVADGMGGHAYGEYASRFALETLVSQSAHLNTHLGCSDALKVANDRIYDIMQHKPEMRGMGTTIVGAAISTRSLIHFNIGDSRIYRHSSGKLTRLSQDDVPSDSLHFGMRSSHMITQSLGGRSSRTQISPHVASIPALQPSEALLLCSDGLTDMVEESEILLILEGSPGVKACVDRLLEAAQISGGQDNISAIVARVE